MITVLGGMTLNLYYIVGVVARELFHGVHSLTKERVGPLRDAMKSIDNSGSCIARLCQKTAAEDDRRGHENEIGVVLRNASLCYLGM